MKLVENNLGLAFHEAGKFRNKGVDFDDLVAVAMVGLFRAARDYDPKRAAFSTYATWWIRQAIQREIANHRSTVRAPAYVQHALNKKLREGQELTRYERAAAAARKVELLDSDAPIVDASPTPFEDAAARDQAQRLQSAVEDLEERAAFVVRAVFLNGRTLAETAGLLGCSRPAVAHARDKALHHLRRKLAA